jgi:hypothetical protein
VPYLQRLVGEGRLNKQHRKKLVTHDDDIAVLQSAVFCINGYGWPTIASKKMGFAHF